MAATAVLLPDAGPRITLAYADSLNLLFKPGWPIMLVDMLLREVARNQTPTSDTIGRCAEENTLPIRTTRILQHRQQALAGNPAATRTAHPGELAIQETMNDFALDQPSKTGVFLFEGHKIARASFLLPDNCRKISTRAFLLFKEQQGWLESTAKIEGRAILAGRNFSRLRFPPQ